MSPRNKRAPYFRPLWAEGSYSIGNLVLGEDTAINTWVGPCASSLTITTHTLPCVTEVTGPVTSPRPMHQVLIISDSSRVTIQPLNWPLIMLSLSKMLWGLKEAVQS